MEATDWPNAYSPSTQAALRFAWAAAAARQGHPVPSPSTAVDLDDLLVGTMLAHPRTSEPELCFRHFGLVAGQVLDDHYPRLTADTLNRCLDELTSPDMPACSSDAMSALSLATSRRSHAKDGRVHLPFLWHGLLSTQSTLTTRLMEAFETRNTDLIEVQRATEEWLDIGEAQPYAAWLEEKFPAPQAPTSVVNFKADTTLGASTASGDLLQIGREVDAFAYLLASKDTRPPLAIGLFGDWGSGKTFFMESVRRRIDSLMIEKAVADQPQGRTPFWKRVISIEFNAWHYAEGDLLASLIDHVFSELRRETYGRASDPATAEKQGWLQELDKTGQALDEKRAALETAKDDLLLLEEEVDQLVSERDEAVRTLEDQVATSSLTTSLEAVVAALREAVGRTELASGLTVEDARRQLDEARREGLRVLGFLRWIGGSGLRSILALLAVVAVPFIVGWIEDVTKSASLAIFSGGAAIALEALAMGTAFVRQHMKRMDEARAKLNAEVAALRGKYQEGIDAKATELETHRDLVSSKQTAVDGLRKERDRLKAEIDTPAGIRIRRFLDERIGSGEYRDRLGVPAIVRRDLRRLTSYIKEQNDKLRGSDNNAPPPLYEVNRIVLYVDDLDRCPDDKVIEVLQAVHLLLAFELFIVVVAVDSRWLSHALEKRYPALSQRVEPTHDRGQARPRDYLEKIFQVPFFVRPLGDTGRVNIVRGLLGDHLRYDGAAGGEGGQPVTHRRIGDSEAAVLDTQIGPRQPPAALATQAFSLTPDDLKFVESLAPLLGDTPRAVKRFVNLFQLLRVLLLDDLTAGPPKNTELAAFLLATCNADPDFASRLVSNPPSTLQPVTVDPPPPELAPVPKSVADWLSAQEPEKSWLTVSSDRIEMLGDIVQRFSFAEARRG